MNPSRPDDNPDRVPLAKRAMPAAIHGLMLHHDFISEDEEELLLRAVDAQPWDATIRRRTQHYGRHFDYRSKLAGEEATPLPEELRALYVNRLTCPSAQQPLVPWQPGEDGGGEDGGDLLQCTVNEYTPGVGIASHVDTHSAFEDGIASLTLGGGCAFRLQRSSDGADLSVWLPPRCLLVMCGAARYEWKHSISGRKYDRVEREDAASDAASGAASAEWEWIPRVRRVSVTLRRLLGIGRRCACAWPQLCDDRPGGAALALPTRLPPPPPCQSIRQAPHQPEAETSPPSPPLPQPPSPQPPLPQPQTQQQHPADGLAASASVITLRERAVAASVGPLISLEKRGYQWDQTAEHVRVTLSLAASAAAASAAASDTAASAAAASGAACASADGASGPSAELESCAFTAASCKLRVASSTSDSRQRFFFDVGAFAEPIDPEASRVVLSKRAPRVTLILAKRDVGVEWTRLRTG